MAHRTANHSDLTKFGNRLYQLMESKKINTSKQLATELYDRHLIKIKSRKKHPDALSKRKSSIGSIEHKINEHINSDDNYNLSGEYANAYASYFNCSYDYLFGLTNIISYDSNVREVCDFLDLSEESINSLKYRGDVFNKYYPNNSRNILDLLLTNLSFKEFLSKIYDIDLEYENACNSKNKIEIDIKKSIPDYISNLHPDVGKYTWEDIESMNLNNDEQKAINDLSNYLKKLSSIDENYHKYYKINKYELYELYIKFINEILEW